MSVLYRLLRVLILGFALLLGPLAASAIELDPALEKEAALVFESVMSPFCAGRLLRDCPSSAAHELRDKIRQQILDGQSHEQAIEFVLSLYGPEMIAVPKTEGFGLLAWLAPPLFVLLGLIGIFVWLRLKRSREVEVGAAKPMDPEIYKRIQSEIDS